jgi:hypothetical protein
MSTSRETPCIYMCICVCVCDSRWTHLLHVSKSCLNTVFSKQNSHLLWKLLCNHKCRHWPLLLISLHIFLSHFFKKHIIFWSASSHFPTKFFILFSSSSCVLNVPRALLSWFYVVSTIWCYMYRLLRHCARHEGVCGTGGLAPIIPNLGTRWRWALSFTPWSLDGRENSSVFPPIARLRGPPSRSGRFGKEKNLLRWPKISNHNFLVVETVGCHYIDHAVVAPVHII